MTVSGAAPIQQEPASLPAPRTTATRVLLRLIRHLPDRISHSLRRPFVRASLRRSASIENVLVLCYGNICRSPYAAAVLRRLLSDGRVAVRSAGFVRGGRSVPAEGLGAASRQGVDLSDHRSTLVTPEIVRSAQLVVVMDEAQARAVRRLVPGHSPNVIVLGDLDPAPFARRAITDPWGRSADTFVEVYARLDRCASELAAALGSAAS